MKKLIIGLLVVVAVAVLGIVAVFTFSSESKVTITTETVVAPAAVDYAGAYLDENNDSSLIISAMDDGAYAVSIAIFRLTSIDDGIGHATDNGLDFTATDAAGNPIGGVITLNGDSAVVTFTSTTWEYLHAGDSFTYVRAK